MQLEKSHGKLLTPLHEHELEQVNPLTIYQEGRWWCDNCNANSNPTSLFPFHCRTCSDNFDLCYSCAHAHIQLQHSTLAHQHQLLYLQTSILLGTWRCAVCKNTSDTLRETYSYHCSTCRDFDICSSCFGPSRHPVHIHELKVVDTRLIYAQTGRITCDICGQQSRPYETFSHHCAECEFDVCHDCFKPHTTPLHNHPLYRTDTHHVYAHVNGAWRCDNCGLVRNNPTDNKPWHCQNCQYDLCRRCMTRNACSDPLGMESRLITDAQITASSEWDENYAAVQGRLNFQASEDKAGGWAARFNDVNQWFMIDLGSLTEVTRIATQGRNGYSQWVTKYKLQYSNDGVDFHYYRLAGQSSPKEFNANRDKDTVVYHQLNPPILARYIKLNPTAWHFHISMRMELYTSCEETGVGMESRDASSVQDQLRPIPLYILARGDEAKAAYQRALETGTTSDKRVKVMLIGKDRAGKTSVGRSLKGEEFSKDESSTEGVQMDKPLKHVGATPWKNSTEEQEMTSFHHKCALHISDHLLTASSEGKALGREEMTEKIAELSIVDELREPQNIATRMSQDVAEPESYGNPDKISSKKREKTKRMDDVPDKVTRLAIKNLSPKKSDTDDGIWPVIWDFAGQAIYRAIHPIFVSKEAIYVLVLDLTKDLSAIASCCVKEPDHEEAEIPAPDSNDTNLDHIMRWMDLVHSFRHAESGKTLPPVILVGTHADLLQEDLGDKMMKIKDKIGDTASVFSDHIIGKTFPVNNTLAGKQAEDPQIVSLREQILKVGKGMPHTKVKVPLKWLQVENEVCDLASKGTNYITREDFKKKICDEICEFKIENDFEVLLKFLHDRGTVVYHGCANDKRSLVVLNPKWLVDILCQIITVEKQSEEETKIQNHRKHLGKTGILYAELLDDSCERLKLKDIKDSLLDIMKKCNLLCEYTSKEGSSIYLVPCMLTSKPDNKPKPGNQEPAPVYITFNTQYVPGGLFSRLVVLFVKYAEIIHSVQPKLYANFARFFIGKLTGVEFVCYKRVIKVRIWDYSNSNSNPVEKEPQICSELFSFLKISLKRLHEECHWLREVSWDLCARCNLCPPKTGECSWHGEKRCCHDDCAHYVSVTQRLFCCPFTDDSNCCPSKTWCQAKALEDASRHNQDEVPDKEQTSIVDSKKQGPNQDMQAIVPAEVARTDDFVVSPLNTSEKRDWTTNPSNDDLELSNSSGTFWINLGRRLKITCICSSEVPGKEQPPIMTSFKRQRPDWQMDIQSTVPANMAHSEKRMKEGILSDNDLEKLSNSIAGHWGKLGRRLNIPDATLDEIEDTWKGYAERARRMLKCWKEKNGPAATYWVLNEALCHEFVNRTDLAHDICFQEEVSIL